MNTKFRKNIFAFTFLLSACGLTAMSSKVYGLYHDGPKAGLNISGRAERIVRSDYAVLELTLSVSGDDCEELFKKLNNQLKELKQFWIQMGVKSHMIHVDNRSHIKISDAKQNNCSMQYIIVLTMNDLDMAPVVQNKTNIFMKKGFVFSAQSLKFFYSKGFELQKELTKEALKDGEKTARENAAVLGLRIEKTPFYIANTSLSTAQTHDHPFPFQRSWEGYGSTDIENKFSVEVHMSYAIKKDDQKRAKAQESSQEDGAESNGQDDAQG